MDEIKKMLQAIINCLSALKQELLGAIHKVDAKKVDSLNTKLEEGFEKLPEKVDKIGLQVAASRTIPNKRRIL